MADATPAGAKRQVNGSRPPGREAAEATISGLGVSPGRTRNRTRRPVWGPPNVARTRVTLGLAGLLLTALPLRRQRIGPGEARAFRAVNGLPEFLYRPTWVVMQFGALGGAWAFAALTYLRGRRQLALRLAEAGTVTWLLSKVVKRLVRRGRPASLLDGVRHRGKPARGLGYLSGHAGVAVALAGAALPGLSRRGWVSMLTLVLLVGLARIYVGAHLPLDVAGGAALGLAVDGALSLRDARR